MFERSGTGQLIENPGVSEAISEAIHLQRQEIFEKIAAIFPKLL